ncbi:MAG: hypothetical protein EU532_11205 [Promethearchaeota archaeon]|nr:MAG: hypothetical protein EU532_11205 [Candidatus Lokiarchaeota archaeon]
MSEKLKEFLEQRNLTWFHLYLIIEFLILIPSILIPHYIIIQIHAIYGCGHHSGGIDGDLWEWGRAFGWTALIWFIISSFQGFTMNKHAKLFHKRGKRKARDLHCISSFLCILFAFSHFYLLYISEPWRSIFFRSDREHFSFNIFQLKIGTGVYFAVVMTIVSILSMAARESKIMKIIGYRRFRIIHWIIMISTIILIIHILYINTEIWIITGGRLR